MLRAPAFRLGVAAVKLHPAPFPMLMMHYIVVRRDLPIGVCCAQVAHAAGESFYALAFPGQTRTADKDHPPVVGSIPTSGANFQAHRTIVAVLGARNAQKLERLERSLQRANIPHVAIREPDEPWNGQLMAIGLVPGARTLLHQFVRDFQTLRELNTNTP